VTVPARRHACSHYPKNPDPINEEEESTLLFPRTSIHPRTLRAWQQALQQLQILANEWRTRTHTTTKSQRIVARSTGAVEPERGFLLGARRLWSWWWRKRFLCSLWAVARAHVSAGHCPLQVRGGACNFYGAQRPRLSDAAPNSFFCFFNWDRA
jgi:hypothetical protein